MEVLYCQNFELEERAMQRGAGTYCKYHHAAARDRVCVRHVLSLYLRHITT